MGVSFFFRKNTLSLLDKKNTMTQQQKEKALEKKLKALHKHLCFHTTEERKEFEALIEDIRCVRPFAKSSYYEIRDFILNLQNLRLISQVRFVSDLGIPIEFTCKVINRTFDINNAKKFCL